MVTGLMVGEILNEKCSLKSGKTLPGKTGRGLDQETFSHLGVGSEEIHLSRVQHLPGQSLL